MAKEYDILEKLDSDITSPAIVIRHTEREKIEDPNENYDASLTKKGKKDAIDFGNRLPKNQNIRIYHSWIHRCQRTAELILKGLRDNGGKGNIIGGKDFISFHFFGDEERGLKLFNEYGIEGFVQNWFSNNLDKSVVHEPNQCRKKVLNSILNNFSNSLDIFVTHDWNIILLLSYLYDLPEEDFKWPGFLEGVLIEKGGSNFRLYYNNRENSFKTNEI